MGRTFDTGFLRNVVAYDASGNVGLGGAVDATYKLKVTGAMQVTGGAILSGANYDAYVDATNANTLNFGYNTNAALDGWINYKGYAGGLTQFRNTKIGNGKGGEIATFVGSTGNLGIGTSSPFSTSGFRTVQITSSSTTNQSLLRLTNSDETTVGGIYTNGGSNFTIGTSTAHPLVFHTQDTERMRITSGGYLKVSNNGVYLNSTDTFHEIRTTSNSQWNTVFTTATVDPYGIRILYSNASPNGGSNYFIYAQDSTTARYTVSSNGSASSSDERLKKNIETTRDGYLEDLCKLRVVKYNWYNQDDTDDKLLGVIAQEVEEVFPKLIKEEKSTDETTTYKMIKDSVLPYMLLKALQEANTKIEELKTFIAAK